MGLKIKKMNSNLQLHADFPVSVGLRLGLLFGNTSIANFLDIKILTPNDLIV